MRYKRIRQFTFMELNRIVKLTETEWRIRRERLIKVAAKHPLPFRSSDPCVSEKGK